MRRARVFISCGQRNDREIKIGKAVEKFFKERGFEAYFAEEVHSPEALTENIFKFLRESEYFVFIDFKREPLSEGEYRGSLFVNQELAIATFLQLPGMGFAEKGTKREGIRTCQIYNAACFEDGTEIIKELKEQTQGWDPDSANELNVAYDPEHTTRDIVIGNHPQKPHSDWYHLDAINRHKTKHALSCLGYITSIHDLGAGRQLEIPTVELIWAGTGDIVAHVVGGTRRELDAFYAIHGENQIRFQHRPVTTTAPRYSLPVLSPGRYRIDFAIISANFAQVSKSFILDFKSSRHILFEEASSTLLGGGGQGGSSKCVT